MKSVRFAGLKVINADKAEAVIDAESYHRFHLNEAARLRSLTRLITTEAAKARVLEKADEHDQRAAELIETKDADALELDRPVSVGEYPAPAQAAQAQRTAKFGFIRRK